MTNHWVDIKNADVILIMGGNAAEAHPCGFKWVTEAKAHRKARLIVVDPRFTRSAAMSDLYAPIRVGTDIAFLGGVIHVGLQQSQGGRAGDAPSVALAQRLRELDLPVGRVHPVEHPADLRRELHAQV